MIAPLRDAGVLIVSSGFSFHDTRGIMSGTGKVASATFDRWLDETMVHSTPEERDRRLIDCPVRQRPAPPTCARIT